jgi:SCY1-like protein 1
LDQLTDDFPEEFFKMKVLPELLKSVEFGGGGPKALGIVMKIATKLSNDDFDVKLTPAIIRLFGNPDRAIRVCLLDGLPMMIDRLTQKTVNDKIFPQIVCLHPIRYRGDSSLTRRPRSPASLIWPQSSESRP